MVARSRNPPPPLFRRDPTIFALLSLIVLKQVIHHCEADLKRDTNIVLVSPDIDDSAICGFLGRPHHSLQNYECEPWTCLYRVTFKCTRVRYFWEFEFAHLVTIVGRDH
jgi:hypothetical protein